MKTINISIIGSAQTEVLKALHQRAMTHSYLGADQNYNLLLKITYDETQEAFIKEILKYLNAMEELQKLFDLVLENEFEKRMQQYKRAEKIKNSSEPKTLKSILNS